MAGLLFVVTFSLYVATLAPSVVTLFDDSLEFQLVTYQLGIAHPTGYPLYTLLGKLFTFLPIGNVAYRVNLMSAFWGAATVALLYLLIVQTTTSTGVHPKIWTPTWLVHLSGLMGACWLAVSPVFWQQATIAEVYTLNAFFVVLLLLVALWRLPPTARGSRRVLWLAGLSGLALTHHRTTLLLLPALGLYAYLNQNPGFLKKPGFYQRFALTGLLLVAPLLLYLHLPLRGHVGSLDGTYENSWGGFWRQVSAGGYGAFVFGNPFNQARNMAFYWNLFQDQFYTIVPGVIGLAALLWRGPHRVLALTGLAFLTYVVFNLFYNVSDIEVFFIPPFLIWAAWSGVGMAFVLRATNDQRSATIAAQQPPPRLTNNQLSKLKTTRFIFAGLILAIFSFSVFKLAQTTLPLLTTRNTWQVHDYGLDMLQQPLPQGKAAIVGIVGEMTLLRYFQQTEKRRPDVDTVAADKEGERLAAVEKLLAQGKVVYLTRELPGAPERWSLSAVGPLIKVNPMPLTTLPNLTFAVNQAVTPAIILLGYDLGHPPYTGDGVAPLRLTLYWQVSGSVTASLKVSARLLVPTGEVVSAVDAIPVHFAYPTTAWRPGEIITDVYDLVLPTEVLPGGYKPLLIWYDPAQNAAEVGRIELNPVELP
jgi:hypothetical protein